MTLSTTTSRASYQGAGAPGPFPVPFKFFEPDDLVLTVRGADGTERTLTRVADYTVAGAGAAAGGSVTLTAPLAEGEVLVILRERPLTQTTDIRNQGTYFPESLEDALDHLTMLVQQLRERIAAGVQLERTVDPNAYGLQLPPPINGRVLGYQDRLRWVEQIPGPPGPAGPPTTDAALLTEGTLADERLAPNVVRTDRPAVFTALVGWRGVGLAEQVLFRDTFDGEAETPLEERAPTGSPQPFQWVLPGHEPPVVHRSMRLSGDGYAKWWGNGSADLLGSVPLSQHDGFVEAVYRIDPNEHPSGNFQLKLFGGRTTFRMGSGAAGTYYSVLWTEDESGAYYQDSGNLLVPVDVVPGGPLVTLRLEAQGTARIAYVNGVEVARVENPIPEPDFAWSVNYATLAAHLYEARAGILVAGGESEPDVSLMRVAPGHLALDGTFEAQALRLNDVTVEIGPPDSAGPGYRALRVPN